MGWPEMEGKRLALVLISTNPRSGGGIVNGRVRRVEEGFVLQRTTGAPFSLLPEWAGRARSIDDVDEPDVRAIIGNAKYFLLLSVGDLEDGVEAGLLRTGFKWNEFTENGAG